MSEFIKHIYTAFSVCIVLAVGDATKSMWGLPYVSSDWFIVIILRRAVLGCQDFSILTGFLTPSAKDHQSNDEEYQSYGQEGEYKPCCRLVRGEGGRGGGVDMWP